MNSQVIHCVLHHVEEEMSSHYYYLQFYAPTQRRIIAKISGKSVRPTLVYIKLLLRPSWAFSWILTSSQPSYSSPLRAYEASAPAATDAGTFSSKSANPVHMDTVFTHTPPEIPANQNAHA